MKRVLLLLAIGWSVIFLTIVCYVDFDTQMQPLIQISDYLMTFHVGGSLMAHGQTGLLYPPLDSVMFAGMPFDKAAHVLLPKMPPSSVAEFMYMPLAAVVFVPFSYAPLNWSLFLWQVSSLLALFFSVQCLWWVRTAGSDERDGRSAMKSMIFRSLSVLWLLPVCLTLWIGQVGLLFGMLPLAIGYCFLGKNRPFMAGLFWSLAIFKPQFLVPAFVIIFALVIRKQFKCLCGAALGIISILLLNVCLFTPALTADWLRCLKISDIVYSDPRSGIAMHIATSLPRTLILLMAGKNLLIVKPIIYGLSALLFGTALFAVWKSWNFSKKPGLSKQSNLANLSNFANVSNLSNLDDDSTLRLAFLIGIFVTPLVMPHFFLYDYCLFGLTLPLAFFSKWPEPLGWSIKKVVLLSWLVINIYSIIVMSAHQFAIPLVFMLAMLAFYIALLRVVWQAAPEPTSEELAAG